MAVPTTGMKLRGRYSRYRMIALGVNLAKGFLANLPSRAIVSPPVLICRPSLTRFVQSCFRSVPSNVSTSASSMKNVRDSKLTIVELSLSVSRAADIAAAGPEVNAMMAICGTYAIANISVVTPIEVVSTAASLDVKGRHRSR